MNIQTSRRDVFRQLLADNNITQQKAADILAKRTKRPCKVRTVRSWLADPELASARSCPEWAVKELTSHFSKKKA